MALLYVNITTLSAEQEEEEQYKFFQQRIKSFKMNIKFSID